MSASDPRGEVRPADAPPLKCVASHLLTDWRRVSDACVEYVTWCGLRGYVHPGFVYDLGSPHVAPDCPFCHLTYANPLNPLAGAES